MSDHQRRGVEIKRISATEGKERSSEEVEAALTKIGKVLELTSETIPGHRSPGWWVVFYRGKIEIEGVENDFKVSVDQKAGTMTEMHKKPWEGSFISKGEGMVQLITRKVAGNTLEEMVEDLKKDLKL